MKIKESSGTVAAFFWKLSERGAAQIITLVVQIVLARLLLPNEFGAISILLVFINIANVFIQKGFASSLIRKEDVEDIDYSTAFVISEIIAILCIIVLFASADKIELFYNIPKLANCMRILSLTLVFGALYSIQNAELIRKMCFKQIFIRSMIASLISGAIGIISAIYGLGVWALVLQTFFQQVIMCITTAMVCEWKPHFAFSRKSFNELFAFGSNILLAELISIGVENIRTLIIGKKFTSSDLAYYDRGQMYPATAMRSIYDSISSVLLPSFSKIQNEKERLARSVGLSINISIFLVCPLFIGFAAVAQPLVVLLLTEKWQGAIPFVVVFCIYQIAFPVYGIMRQSLYALGKSKEVLYNEISRGILFIGALIMGVFYNPFVIAILSCIAMYITTAIYVCVVKKYIPLKIKKLVSENLLTVLQSLIMWGIIYLINKIDMIYFVQLIVDILVGVIVYIIMSMIFKNKSFIYCIEFIKQKI